MASRTDANGTACLQPWFKKINNYGKAPYGTVAAVNLTSGATSTRNFAVNPISIANCNVDMGVLGVASGTAAMGGLPHDSRGQRAFKIAFSDGHQ